MVVKWITKRIVRYMMKDVLKDGLPVIQLLIKNKALTPCLLIAAVGAGYWFDKLTGDIPMIVCGVALIAFWVIRAFVTKKG